MSRLTVIDRSTVTPRCSCEVVLQLTGCVQSVQVKPVFRAEPLCRQAVKYNDNSYRYFITFCMRHSQGEMYIGHSRLSVCVYLYLAAFLYYRIDLAVTLGNGGCALLGRFAISGQVLLLKQHACAP